MKNRFTVVLLCAVVSICSSVICVAAYHRYFSIRIVAADTSAYLEQVRIDYLNRRITPAELDQQIENVIAILRKQPENTIVLSSDVVLSKNVEIITP